MKTNLGVQWLLVWVYWVCYILVFLEDISLFCGATDTPVLDFCNVCPGSQSQGWILFAFFLACMLFPRFTSGVTPADCIEVSIAAESFLSTYLQICPQALVEAQARIRVCCILIWMKVDTHRGVQWAAVTMNSDEMMDPPQWCLTVGKSREHCPSNNILKKAEMWLIT